MKREDLQKELIKRKPGLRQHLEENEAKKNLAVALMTLRKKAGLTQVQLAQAADMTQAQISKIESPTGPMPNTDTIRRYSDACGFVTVIDFYESKTNRQKAPRTSSGSSTAPLVIGGRDGRYDQKFRVAAAPLSK